MKSEYTKGEWKVKRNSGLLSIEADEKLLLIIHHHPRTTWKEEQANARLIAQAPKLYEACREAWAWLSLDEHVTAKQLARKLERVIASVEGE